jgi:hypothetical protein
MYHKSHLLPLLLVGCFMTSAGHAATDNMEAEIAAGRAEARKDLAAGELGYRMPVPEMFLLSSMGDHNDDAHLFDFYETVLRDRFGVKLRIVMYHAATPPEERCRAQGYDEEMTAVIEKRFGAGVLDKTWKETCALPDAKRAEYLNSRPKPGSPTSRPTTQPTTAPEFQ